MVNYMELIEDSLKSSAFPQHFLLCESIKSHRQILTINKEDFYQSFSSFIVSEQYLKLSFAIFQEFIIHFFTLLSSAINLVCIELYFNTSFRKKYQVFDTKQKTYIRKK